MVRPVGGTSASAASTPRSRITAVAWWASGAKASHCAAVRASRALSGSLSNTGSSYMVWLVVKARSGALAAPFHDNYYLQVRAGSLQFQVVKMARQRFPARLQLHGPHALVAAQRDPE